MATWTYFDWIGQNLSPGLGLAHVALRPGKTCGEAPARLARPVRAPLGRTRGDHADQRRGGVATVRQRKPGPAPLPRQPGDARADRPDAPGRRARHLRSGRARAAPRPAVAFRRCGARSRRRRRRFPARDRHRSRSDHRARPPTRPNAPTRCSNCCSRSTMCSTGSRRHWPPSSRRGCVRAPMPPSALPRKVVATFESIARMEARWPAEVRLGVLDRFIGDVRAGLADPLAAGARDAAAAAVSAEVLTRQMVAFDAELHAFPPAGTRPWRHVASRLDERSASRRPAPGDALGRTCAPASVSRPASATGAGRCADRPAGKGGWRACGADRPDRRDRWR